MDKDLLNYFNGDELAASTWQNKYALRDNDGNFIEKSPIEMHRRLAKEFWRVEKEYISSSKVSDKSLLSEYGQIRSDLTEDKIFELFDHFKYIVPAGSVMSGAGSGQPISLSNCFVLPTMPEDSYSSIMHSRGEMVQLEKRRGGIGLDLSKLRPAGAFVNNAAKTSTGAASFMEGFSAINNEVAQCIEGNQELLTKTGLVKIKDIKIGDEVFTKKGFIKVIGKFDKGNKDIILLTTKHGAKLKATEDHIIMTSSKEKGPINEKISNLKVGDPIAILHGISNITTYQILTHSYQKPLIRTKRDGTKISHNRYEIINIPSSLEEKLAYLIGYCHGDGYTNRQKNDSVIELSVVCNNKDTEILNKILKYREQVFGKRTYTRKGDGDCSRIHICATEGSKFLEENGLDKPKTEYLRVPEKIWQSPSSVQMSYFSGLFDADGYASGKKKGYSLCTVNKDFAEDLKKLLLLNGIYSKIHTEAQKNPNWKTKYYITIIGKYNQEQLLNKSIESIKIQNKKFVSKRDSILSPFIIGTEGIKKEPYTQYGQFVSNASLKRTGMYEDQMMSLDYVENVVPAGNAHVYDIELESENMFWCEGIYVHNCGRRGALMLTISILHPDSPEFIEKKQDLTKVTGANVSVKIPDEFMKAVEEDKDFILRWPIDSKITSEFIPEISKAEYWKLNKYKGVYYKKIRAKELWDKLIHCAWNTAEPGILFESQLHNWAPDGVYPKFKAISTNPCVTGDTKIAVADGRGYIPIKQLAEEGKDVDVYCLDKNGKLTISKMINPRVTGYDQDIYEITFENGHVLKCTGNHKIKTNNRGYVSAKDLEEGDSIFLLTKSQMNWEERYFSNGDNSRNKQPYNFISISGQPQSVLEHRLIYNRTHPENKNPEVIHHIDFNGLNNSPSNLEGMTRKDHIRYHSDKIKGKNNPIWKIKSDPDRLKSYSEKMSKATSGENNGRCKHKSKDYYAEAVKFAKELGRNFYLKEWLRHCEKIGYPKVWDKFLKKTFGSSEDFIKKVSKDARVKFISVRGKIIESYLKAEESGYTNITIGDNDRQVFVEKFCEECGKKMIVPWLQREKSFCSLSCAAKYAKKTDNYRKGITKASFKRKQKYIAKNKKLIEFFKSIDDGISRSFKEIKSLFTRRTKEKYDSRASLAFKTEKEFLEAVKNYNHKVISVKLIGKDTVYNGTVEKYHNYFSGEFIEKNEFDRQKTLSINQLNCGEIPMSSDSCRLIHCNLTSFVDNPYQESASINYDRVYKVFYEATRLGDDLVELEIEAVNRILNLVSGDEFEKVTWQKLLDMALEGRRAGVGFFGLSDLIASLGIKFCSPESIEITDHLCKIMMKAELDAEIDMAIERGCFPGYDKNIEVPGANDWYSFIEQTYPEQWERMQKYGRRNVSFSTIAPTGSVAMVARASSGIEPVFMPLYTRRRKCNSEDEHYDFVDKLGVKFQEFVVVHPGLENWAKIKYPNEDTKNWKIKQWEEVFKVSPWNGSTSPEIDWEKRVELQGVVQKYITHAISSTVNLPNSVTEEEVSKIYLTAWKTGNKGQTVYRDGCRDGVLISVNEKKKDEKFRSYVEAPKRPKVLEADFHTTRVKGEVFYVMVGLYLDKPYEVFVYKPELSEGEKIPKQHRGEIIKVKKGVYTFKSDQITIENISKDLSPLEYTVVLFSSMLLRTGANLKYVLKTAQKAKDGINGFVSALVRILSKYSPEELLKGEVCPECGNDLTREGGCIICKNCGYSKCL